MFKKDGLLQTTTMSYYDEIAPGYDRLHKEEQLTKIMCVIDGLNISREDTVLDVGCGTAFSFELLHPIGCRYQGAEPSKGLIEHSRYPNKITLCSAESLPFPDGLFTAVISITALQNFDDSKKGLEEMERVCSDRLAITFLKKSPKKDLFDQLLKELFVVEQVVECNQDLVYFLSKKECL